ncbi:thiamine diphosphokinase [uncultured Phascolarctobacterium sp.]|uniref:thiamine diphosphokinase n=1 Tax=uncultured Phascolarctobacterium sp. TaxID=512296 RepID=UPI0025E7F762|nr:thiamine diphosphokinase [uncultured Phascolarctobacterium sp.]
MAAKLFVLPELELRVMFHVKHHAAALSPNEDLLVVAGGRGPQNEWLHSVSSGKKIYCADCGAEYCLAAGCVIAELFGDCDSSSQAVYKQARAAGTEVHSFNPAKDDTDLQLLLQNLPEGDIIASGIWGGRFDHLYSNVYTLLGVKKQRGCQVILADDKEFMLLLTEGESAELKLQVAAEAVSLLPLSESTTVDFTGVRWPLQQAILRQLYPYAISNEMRDGADKICCSCHSGALGLYIRWAEGSK